MAENLPISLTRSRDLSRPATLDTQVRNAKSTDARGQSQGGVRTLPQMPDANALPPDGGYGWVCVACTAFINAHTWGINSTYGVFLAHYLSFNTFPGTSPLTYAFVGGLSISIALFVAPLATYIIHVFGTKTALNIGVFFETLSLIAASFAHSIWQLILSQGVCFGIGMGFLFVGNVGIVPQWFLKRRSLANSIAAAGSGFGGLTYALATQKMIDTIGLAWAFRVLGILACVVNLTASNLMRDRNKLVGARHSAFHLPLLKSPQFLLLLGWGIFTLLGYTVLLFSLPNFATSIGLSPSQGSVVGALNSLGQGLGRPIVGLVSDRCGRINTAGTLTFFTAVLCFAVWIPAGGMGVLSFFSVLSGTMSGTYWATVGPVSAEVVGLQMLPSALSITWVSMVAPTTVAEAIALELKKRTGKIYINTQIFTAMMYIAATLCMWLLRGWKIGESEEDAKRAAIFSQQSSVIEKQQETDLSGNETTKEGPQRAIATAAGIRGQRWQPKDLFRRMLLWQRV